MNGRVIWKFLCTFRLQKLLGNICFFKQIFYRKQSLGAPIVKSVANAQRNWAELALAKTFAKTSGTRQSVIGLFCIFFSRSLIGQLSFLLVPSMVHAKMNVHKHRTKQTYESNKFQYLKSFCLNTSFTFNGGCRPSLVYLYMISPIRS